MPSRRDISLIAASLDLPKALAPHAATLMEEIDSLGSFPIDICFLCLGIGLGNQHRVLDLACGKGTVSLALARLLHCDVTGIDLSPDFIQFAKKRMPRKRNVRFKVADVEEFKSSRLFDLVLMLNLYPAKKALTACRKFVKPGGFVIVDDAVCVDGGRSAQWPTIEEMRVSLEAGGCRVVDVEQPLKRSVVRSFSKIQQELRCNCRRLMKRQPGLSRPVREYLSRVSNSRKLLTGPLRPTFFLIQVPGKSMQSRPRTDR